GLDELGVEPAHEDRKPRDRDGAQLVEVATFDLLDEVEGSAPEGRREQQRARQLEARVVLTVQERRVLRREDPRRLADVHDEEEERDEQRRDERVRRAQGLAQRARAEDQRLPHASTSWTSPATRWRVRPVASRNTSSSVGAVARPRAACRSDL